MVVERQKKLQYIVNCLRGNCGLSLDKYNSNLADSYYKDLMEELKMLDERDKKIAGFEETLKHSTPEIMPMEAKTDLMQPKEIIVVRCHCLISKEDKEQMKMAIKKGVEEGIIIIDSKAELALIRSVNGVNVEIKVI